MTPAQFEEAGKKLFGNKHWKVKLAEALGINPATVWRMKHRKEVPGVYEVALRGLLQHKRAQDILDKEARKLLPRKFKLKRKTYRDGTPVRKQKKGSGRRKRIPLPEGGFEDKLEQTVEMERAHTETDQAVGTGHQEQGDAGSDAEA